MERLADISQFESLMNSQTQPACNTILDKIKNAYRWHKTRRQHQLVKEAHQMMKAGETPAGWLMRKIGMCFLWLVLAHRGCDTIQDIQMTNELLDTIKTSINTCTTTEELKTLNDFIAQSSLAKTHLLGLTQAIQKRQKELGQDTTQTKTTGYPEMPQMF